MINDFRRKSRTRQSATSKNDCGIKFEKRHPWYHHEERDSSPPLEIPQLSDLRQVFCDFPNVCSRHYARPPQLFAKCNHKETIFREIPEEGSNQLLTALYYLV